MPDLKLVIFDCDGVLVDSERISNGVLADLLTAEGLTTTLAQARAAYQGLLLAEVQERAQASLGKRLANNWLIRFEQERVRAFERDLRPIEGADEMLRIVRSAGLDICVASQGKIEKTQLTLGLTGLRDHFEDRAIFSAEQVARGKPYPDLFLHAASVMGAHPAQCVVVEDTPSGVRAGVAAAMRVFGYAADSEPAALIESGAEVFWGLAELPRLLALGRVQV